MLGFREKRRVYKSSESSVLLDAKAVIKILLAYPMTGLIYLGHSKYDKIVIFEIWRVYIASFRKK